MAPEGLLWLLKLTTVAPRKALLFDSEASGRLAEMGENAFARTAIYVPERRHLLASRAEGKWVYRV